MNVTSTQEFFSADVRANDIANVAISDDPAAPNDPIFASTPDSANSYTSTYGVVSHNFSALTSNRLSISAATGAQSNGTAIATDNGNSVSIYYDGTTGQLVGRTIASIGTLGAVVTLTTTGFQPDTNGAHDEVPVSAARLTNGNIVVTWSAGSSIYARIFDANLSAVTGEIVIGTPALAFYHEYSPDVAALANGDFVVAWQDLLGASESHIRVGRFTSTGAAVTSFTADAPSNLSDERPAIAGLADGGYVLGFDRRDNTPAAATQIFGAIYNADNSVRSAATLIDGTGTINRDVDVAARPDGGFNFYYEDSSPVSVTNTQISVLSSTNGTLTALNAATLGSSTNDHGVHAGPYGANGYSLVLWTDTSSSTDHNVYGRVVTADGTVQPNNILLTAASTLETAGTAIWLDTGAIGIVYDNATGSLNADKDGAVELQAYAITRTTTGTAADETIDFRNDPFINTVRGDDGNDTIYGAAADDLLSGQGGNDIIYAGAGDDQIMGGTGSNQLYGGAGNDSFTVSGTDTIVELANEGVDVVYAEVSSFTLPANVEHLIYNLTSGDFTGTGNDLINEVAGGSGNDTLSGMGGDDYLLGYGGNDTLRGGDGNDHIDGGSGTNALFGDAGDDRLIVNNGEGLTTVDGGAGYDTLSVTGTIRLGGLTGVEAIELQSATLRLTGAQFNTFAPGTPLSGTGTIYVSMAASDIEVDAQFLTVAAGSNVTISVVGSGGVDVIKGSTGGVNGISGGPGGDQIRGGPFADTIYGDDGDDKLAGAHGADTLVGGNGADVFRYLTAQDSGLGVNGDHIVDFAIGTDHLGFTLIDADAVAPGDQPFSFIGTSAFANTGIGQIHYLNSGANLLVQVDVDGNGTADMDIVLDGLAGHTLTSADFLL